MTGSIRSICIGAASAALALGLAACSQTTYGTGTPTGVQTLEDLAGIADFGGSSKEPIKYSARPGVVPPPPGTPLPQPGSDQQPTVASNWPNDPDAESKRFKAEAAAREKFCAESINAVKPECQDPGWRLPTSADAKKSRAPSPTLVNMNVDPAVAALSTPEQNAKATKLFAEARNQVAVDENGNPIRRYLTDPPPDYRIPDPNAPVVIDNKPATKKKWKWPWQ